MASSSTIESSLITKLESATSTPLFSLFSDYLHPFTALTDSNNKTTQSLSRSLAKQFLPFLNRSISLLRKRLSDPSKLRPDAGATETPKFVLELFDIYRLSLHCLDLISSQLSCKPHTVYEQRVNLLCCLKAWGFYSEARSVGFWVLEKLRGLDLVAGKGKKKSSLSEFVPVFAENRDVELVRLVVDVVRIIVECVALGRSKDAGDYMKVIKIVEEGAPWFRALEANTYEKLHRALVSNLGKTTIFLVEELMKFGGDVVCSFCVMTLNMYASSSKKDQIYKFARQISSALFLLQDDRHSEIINILRCVLDTLCNICKVEVEIWETEFIEFVSYCAHKCRTASAIFCSAVAEHLNFLAGKMCQVMTPLESIIRLYAAGLCYGNNVIGLRLGNSMPSTGRNDRHAVGALLDGIGLCNLAPLLGAIKTYFCSDNKENCMQYDMDCNDLAGQLRSHSTSDFNASSICLEKRKEAYLLAYINVLKFLCEPLAELVNSEKKQIVNEADAASVSNALYYIQETFHQFCDVTISYYSCTPERENNLSDGNKVIPSVAVAAFTLSIRMKVELQKSVHSLEQIISSKWIQPQALKYIFVSLYNVGVILYRNNKVNEASKALNLCHRASWTCVVQFCQMLMRKSNDFIGDPSEEQVVNFIAEACARTAFVLDVLDQCESPMLKKLILDSLEKWSAAENLLRVLPGPIPLVKKWVKIQCRLNKNMADCSAPTLYSLLSSSARASPSTVGKILEQELFAYEEHCSMHPDFCQIMQKKILNNLLEEVYVTQDSYLQKSRILLSKGRAFRARGFEGLKDCIECLSEAIYLLKQNCETCCLGAPTCHQLAVAYCLRALCTYEAEPNSKQPLENVQAALRVWLTIPVADYDSVYSDCRMSPNGVLLLLYNIIDLLSVMGSMEFHHDIYKLMIRLFEWKNMPMEKWLPKLWESRRLSHALCISPINDVCITNLLGDYGEQFMSMEFWLSCLRGSSPLLLGFQQTFSYLSTSSHIGIANIQTSYQSDVTINNVKEAAFELISSVPAQSASAFFAGYLYYDLSERLISSGRLFEALSCAQEAHRLRTRLFQEKFVYSVEHRIEKHSVIGHQIYNLQVNKSFAFQAWPSNTISLDLEACYLSPWKVLQCYLESTLQLGVINEMIGNGVEAEAYLLWGKDISCKQNLLLLTVGFSSVLGQLYRKKQSWDLSEKELLDAKQILEKHSPEISCLKCRLILQVSVDQQLGDLQRSRIFGVTKNVSLEGLVHAESFYKSALDKLNLSEWKNSLIHPNSLEEGEDGAENSFNVSAMTQQDVQDFATTKVGSKAKIERRKCRKTRNVQTSSLREQSSTAEINKRLTRSRCRSSRSNAVVPCPPNHSKDTNISNKPDAIIDRNSSSEMRRCMVDLGCGITCNGNSMNCWFCLVKQVKESGSLSNSINLKWEFVRRKLALRALTSIGKCLEAPAQIGEKHDIIVQSLSILVCRNPFIRTVSPLPLPTLIDVIGNESLGDVFAIERAALLLNLCLFSLKVYHSHDSRTICCDLCNMQLEKIVSLLMVAFVLCREVSTLLPKVSRLLSMIYVLSSSRELFTLPTFQNKLSASHWASYFHQASIGTHLNSRLFSNFGRCKSQPVVDDQVAEIMCIREILSWLKDLKMDNVEIASDALLAVEAVGRTDSDDSYFGLIVADCRNLLLSFESSTLVYNHRKFNFLAHRLAKEMVALPDCQSWGRPFDNSVKHQTSSFFIGEERFKLTRLSPASVQDMEKFVADFFTDLPCTTVICISLIGGSYASLLEELLGRPSRVCSWMLLSRFNFNTQPIVMLLPIESVSVEALDGEDADSNSGELFKNEDLEKRWRCPWGLTIVDEVAPTFKLILEENYSSSISSLEDTKENRAFWWTRRKKIDSWLGQLLRKLEDSWFGPWRYVLLGEWSNCKNFDIVQKKLVRDLKLKSKLHVNESFLKVILGGAGYALDEDACYLQLLSLKNGCYIGEDGLSDEERCEKTSVLAVQLLGEALNELKDEDSANRDPVILVLDFDVQMLPWENLPILRNHEVYRMPSVGSISLTLERNCNCQEQGGTLPSPIPFIDPLHAFYLLNPSGDLGRTQLEFENWFRDQNFEGKAGSSPAVEELASALTSHDLFIYFGHGSGAQYISTQEIQKLEKCAATCLMGCSSGSLILNGCYVPQGTPLSYLLAGSPVIVANLWEVTDRDIDRFAKALLDAWLKERCSTSNGCSKCDLLAREFETLTIRGGKGNAKKKGTKKAVSDTTGSLHNCCDHRPKIASFMSQARNACALPYIIGASPVCYGVPTGIRRKEDLLHSPD